MLNKYLLSELMNFCSRQQPWDLALLTETWYTKLSKIKFPFLEEITYGGPVYLKKSKIRKDLLLPSAEGMFSKNYFNKWQILTFVYYQIHV